MCECEKERHQNSNVCFSVGSLGFKVCDWGNRIKNSGIIQSPIHTHTHTRRIVVCQAALIAKEAGLKLTSGTEVIIMRAIATLNVCIPVSGFLINETFISLN